MPERLTVLAPSSAGSAVPAFFAPDPTAARRVLEFFTARIRNPHTRKAYAKAAAEFAAWCEAQSLRRLRDVEPAHVAGVRGPGGNPARQGAAAGGLAAGGGQGGRMKGEPYSALHARLFQAPGSAYPGVRQARLDARDPDRRAALETLRLFAGKHG